VWFQGDLAMNESLTPQHADQLLDKLSTDDAFRAAFQKDPEAALKQLGITHKYYKCTKPQKQLASKEAIAKGRDQLRSMLTAKLDQSPHRLEAS
jgi:putative modified peptide